MIVIGGQAYPLATIGQRAVARLIDGLIYGVVWIAVILAFVGVTFESGDGSFEFGTGSDLAFTLIGAALAIPYETLFVTAKGGTPGKLAMGIRVASLQTAQHPDLVSSFRRWAAPGVPGLIPGVGGLLSFVIYLSFTWGEARRGWHDRFAATAVIRAR